MDRLTTALRSSSPFVAAIEPITESDDEIMQALEQAEIPPLLPALAYLTGDLSLLREDLRPDPLMMADGTPAARAARTAASPSG